MDNKQNHLNEAELHELLAAKTGKTVSECDVFLDAFKKVLIENLPGAERIALKGVGSFNVVNRKARKGRNPRTGAPIQIPSKNVVKFKPGKYLEEAVL